MNKTICNLIFITVLLFMVSCSSKTEYTNAIPEDAAMLASVNLESIVQKSNIEGKEGDALVNKISNALKSGLSGEAYKTAERILKDPSTSGLSFQDKIYLFSTPSSNMFGIIAKVEDEDDVEDLLQALKEENICETINDGDKCKWTKIGNSLCAFNNGTFLLLSNKSGDASSMQETLMSLMRQDKEKSFSNSKAFDKLESSNGDIALITNLSVIPSEITMRFKMGMSADLKLEDLKYLVNISFDKGKIALTSESLIDNPSIIDSLNSQSQAFSPIKGNLIDLYPANTAVWGAISVKGKTLYDILCTNPAIAQMLNNPMLPVDIEEIISAIDGDVSIGYSSSSLEDMIVYAQVTNENFLSSIEDLRPLLAMTRGQMQLNKLSPSSYEFRIMGESIWFGVKENILYITNNSVMAKEALRRYGVSLNNSSWASEVSKNRIFMNVNSKDIYKDISFTTDYRLRIIAPALKYCDYINLMIPDWKSGRIDIVMNDKNINALQLIVKELQNL